MIDDVVVAVQDDSLAETDGNSGVGSFRLLPLGAVAAFAGTAAFAAFAAASALLN